MTDFRHRLISAREKLGLTQAELAKKAGCPLSVIGMLESGARRNTKYLLAIAKALGVTPEWLETGQTSLTICEPEQHYGAGSDESTILQAFRIASPDMRMMWLTQARILIDNADTPLNALRRKRAQARMSANGPNTNGIYTTPPKADIVNFPVQSRLEFD